jgi:hypothetical protein
MIAVMRSFSGLRRGQCVMVRAAVQGKRVRSAAPEEQHYAERAEYPAEEHA